jgi:PEP-CTERM motif
LSARAWLGNIRQAKWQNIFTQLEQTPTPEREMRLSHLVMSSLIAIAPCIANASVVDFENVAAYASGNFSSGGFDFSLNGLASAVVKQQYCGPSCPLNGSNYALAPYGDYNGTPSSLSMTKTGGGTFSFYGFDGSASFNFNQWGSGSAHYIPNQIDVVGVQSNGNHIAQSFLINKNSNAADTLSFTSYTANNSFNDLVSLSFSSSGSSQALYNGFSVDNIQVAPVPEPETYALMGLGLLGLLATRRRKVK